MAIAAASRQAPAALDPLDKILQQAASKRKLKSHPISKKSSPDSASQPLPPQQASPPLRQRSSPQQRKPETPRSRGPSNNQEDNSLLSSISENERDSVWRDIRLAVEGDIDDAAAWELEGRDKAQAPSKRRSAPASARDGLESTPSSSTPASTGGFKGFGSPASSTGRASSSPSTPSSQQPASSHSKPASAPTQIGSSPPQKQQSHKRPLRLFLFAAEEARTSQLLAQMGLAERVAVVTELSQADAIVAAKLGKGGRHVNLAQGEKTAANAGIPFLVVGRNMTADSLRAALVPLLDPAASKGAAAAAGAAAGPGGSKPTAAELFALRADMVRGFGQLRSQGGSRQEPAAGGAEGAGDGVAEPKAP